MSYKSHHDNHLAADMGKGSLPPVPSRHMQSRSVLLYHLDSLSLRVC
jgi:hypothetical protein